MTASHRLVGRIGKPHGLRGEVSVVVRTDSPEERFAVGASLRARTADRQERTLTVVAAREHSGRLLVSFAGVQERAGADALRGTLLFGDPADLPPIDDPDEFYDHELEGLAAATVDGRALGSVREIVHGPAGDLLAIDGPEGELLVPFIYQFVPEVDVAAGHVLIDPPEGLLDS
ncbi:MAG: ribosome maturation factor RimM [Sciscionella sp.]